MQLPENLRQTLASGLSAVAFLGLFFGLELVWWIASRAADRLEPLKKRMEAFVPALEKIDAACLENDFPALESQVEALALR